MEEKTDRMDIRKTLAAVLLVMGFALVPLGCSTAHRESVDAAEVHPNYANLELNDGTKWVVAKPMMAYIRNLEAAVRAVEKTPGRNHLALATEIQDHLGRLVTNCTMEGKAHDELHKWLMPFLALSADYTKATDPQAQEKTLKEIRQSLAVFNRYFE